MKEKDRLLAALRTNTKTIERMATQLQELIELIEEAKAKDAEPVDLDNGIDRLDLPMLPYNTLVRADIRTLRELVSRTGYDLLDFKNFGGGSLRKVRDRLDEVGLHLKDDIACPRKCPIHHSKEN